MKEQEKAYQFWIHNLPEVGDRTIEKLILTFGNEQAVYEAVPKDLGKVLDEDRKKLVQDFTKRWDLQGTYEKLLEKKICFYTYRDQDYPIHLRKLKHPPYGIYCVGNLPSEEKPAAAVIGARECSEYGSFVAKAFAGRLAEAGISIISGMARGIDGIAQQGAVDVGGETYAVLGCGVDICYPASNRRLYEEILAAGGGILSVFTPGTEPQKRNFPERNRIVAGLSDILLVVEARQKSGTWITVDMALEQGKSVYAVPGRLTDRLSDGCNLLIRQGAGIALSPEDLIQELKILTNREGISPGKGKERADQQGAGKEIDICDFLDFSPRTADEILKQMQKAGKKVELSEVLSGLIVLCMEGKAKQEAGCYVKIGSLA